MSPTLLLKTSVTVRDCAFCPCGIVNIYIERPSSLIDRSNKSKHRNLYGIVTSIQGSRQRDFASPNIRASLHALEISSLDIVNIFTYTLGDLIFNQSRSNLLTKLFASQFYRSPRSAECRWSYHEQLFT